MKSFRDLRMPDRIAIFSLLIGGAISAGLASWLGVGLSSYLALLVTALLFLSSEKISRLLAEAEFRDILSRSQENDMVCLGDKNDGIEWFCANFKNTTFVRNTVFCRTLENHEDIPADLRSSLDTAIRAALNQGCKWHDIVATSQREEIEKFYKSLTEDQKSRYRARLLSPSTPILQCMTLRYRHNKARVLFGWNFDAPECTSEAVFQGLDREGFFQSYMRALWERALPFLPPTVTEPEQPPAPAPVVRQATVPPGQ